MKTFMTLLKEALPHVHYNFDKKDLTNKPTVATGSKKVDQKPAEFKIESLNSMGYGGITGDVESDLKKYFENVKGLDEDTADFMTKKYLSKIEYCKEEKKYLYR